MRSRVTTLCLLFAALLSVALSLQFEAGTDIRVETRDIVNINGSNYFISNIDGNIDEAISTCNDLGMKLVSIQSAAKQQAIAYYLDNNGHSDKQFWTSGVRVFSSTFLWSGTGHKLVYSNWYDTEPNELLTALDICVLMMPKSIERKWGDWPCSKSLYFICEQTDNC